MQPAGIAAFEARTDERTGIYSHEQREAAKLTRPQERQFRANPRAWRYFQAQPAGYRRQATWWVVSAKKEETRERRLQRLIADSEQERAVGPLRRPGPKAARPARRRRRRGGAATPRGHAPASRTRWRAHIRQPG